MKQNFVREIGQLLSEVPTDQWNDPKIRGVCYDILPWHRMSCVTVQTVDDDPRDLGAWKYYCSAESDGSLISQEYELYAQTCETDRFVYHRLLIEAAEALLSIDFGKYVPGVTTTYGIGLNKLFLPQVYHGDGVFGFNYCEYVFARQMESAEPNAAPDGGG